MTPVQEVCAEVPEDSVKVYLDEEDDLNLVTNVSGKVATVYLSRASAQRIGTALLEFALHGRIDE